MYCTMAKRSWSVGFLIVAQGDNLRESVPPHPPWIGGHLSSDQDPSHFDMIMSLRLLTRTGGTRNPRGPGGQGPWIWPRG